MWIKLHVMNPKRNKYTVSHFLFTHITEITELSDELKVEMMIPPDFEVKSMLILGMKAIAVKETPEEIISILDKLYEKYYEALP